MSNRRLFLRLPAPRAALLLALLLPVFAWASLTYPGYFELHSGFLPTFNINSRAAHLADPGWIPSIGAPYDGLRGEGATPYTVAALLVVIGVPPITATKAVFGLSLIAASTGMYVWVRRRWGAWPGVIAAAVYVFAPVVLTTVLVRGAFAETAFLGFAPWLLAFADAGAEGRRSASIALAIMVAFALWTQAGLALWLIGGALLYVWAIKTGKGKRNRIIIGLGSGLLAGVLGLLPAALRHGGTGASYVTFADHFVYPHQWLGAWGVGSSIPGAADTLSFNLGFLAFGLTAFAFLLPCLPAGLESQGLSSRRLLWMALALAGGCLLLASTLSAPLWRLLPFLSRSLTYPWQLLLIAVPWWAWLAGAGANRLLLLISSGASPEQPATIAALLALALLPVYGDLHPVTTQVQVAAAPVAIYGENAIALLSVASDGVLHAEGADSAGIEVHWQALRPLDRDYTVFFHVMGVDGKRYGQQDTSPRAGALPTHTWRPGQIVEDRYTAVLSPDAPVGHFEAWLGFYDADGQRLVVGGDDKLILPLGEIVR